MRPYRPTPMNFVMYLEHNQFPAPPKSWRYLCGCGYTVFKASTDNILIANDIGLPWEEYPPGSNILEVQCHNCKTKYKVLFQ